MNIERMKSLLNTEGFAIMSLNGDIKTGHESDYCSIYPNSVSTIPITHVHETLIKELLYSQRQLAKTLDKHDNRIISAGVCLSAGKKHIYFCLIEHAKEDFLKNPFDYNKHSLSVASKLTRLYPMV